MKVCKLFSCRREREKLESTASLTEVTNESWVLLVGVWVLFVNSIVCLFLCLFFVFEFVFLLGLAGRVFVWLVFSELFLFGEFDPGSGRTLAACLTHASRTMMLWFSGVD